MVGRGGPSPPPSVESPKPTGRTTAAPDPSQSQHGIPSATSALPPLSSPQQQPISQLFRYTPNTSLSPSLSLSELTRPGGRQSVSGVVATVFGSTGFLGRYAVNHLGRIGSQVIVPYRGDGMSSSRHLRLNGDLGQIVPVPFSLYDEDSVSKAVQRSNVVVNFIGSRYETANYKYHDVNVKTAARIARISRQSGVQRFIHLSCFGAAHDSPSAYFRSKWEGEQAVLQHYPDATILRPTTVFGGEDRFLNWIASVGEKFAALPVVRGGEQRLQPVYVEDVARAVLSCVMYEESIGRLYEIAGPDIFTLNNIVRLVNHSAFSDIRVLPLPDIAARIYGRLLEGVDGLPLLNRLRAPVLFNSDMVAQAYTDQVPSGEFAGLDALGVEATPLLSEIDTLMLPHRPEGVAPERFQDADRIKEAARPTGKHERRREAQQAAA